MNITFPVARVVRHGFQQLPRSQGVVPLFSRRAASQLCLHQYTPRSSFQRLCVSQQHLRHKSSATGSRPLTDRSSNVPALTPKEDQPSYEMTFTCKKCSERSSHRISKQGYHKGTILIACPGCKNRHLISDHLKIFSDTSLTLEDILKDKGQLLKKGTLGEDGDVEFWEDGSTTAREKKEDKKQ